MSFSVKGPEIYATNKGYKALHKNITSTWIDAFSVGTLVKFPNCCYVYLIFFFLNRVVYKIKGKQENGTGPRKYILWAPEK